MNLQKYKSRHTKKTEVLSLSQYLEKAKTDSSLVLNTAERMLKAIGEPELIDTSKDRHLSDIFRGRILHKYKAFEDFYGLELPIERIVSYFKHAAQGMEESKQILYLVGSVGGGKSSLAERLKELIQTQPFYALALEKDGELVISPVFDNPLCLFTKADAEELGIEPRYFRNNPSAWVTKRLDELEGDISKFKVVKLYPNENTQTAVCKVEAGDENNTDISTLVGKVDIRMLEKFPQNDPDAYRFSGGLCRGNRGIMEFVEMFKAPRPTLNPLLTATQEGDYKGTEAIASIPFEGVIVAHSNESDWQDIKTSTKFEAFVDRIYTVKIPYNLRVDEEVKIYKKFLRNSALNNAPLAPHTLKILAQFSVLSSLDVSSGDPDIKMRVYNGEDLRKRYTEAKSYSEYKDKANKTEGYRGISIRDIVKILASTYNYDDQELGANPISLLSVLHDYIENADLDDGDEQMYSMFLVDILKPQLRELIGEDIKQSCLRDAGAYGQNVFDRYVTYADYWLQETEYRDPNTGHLLDRDRLDEHLLQIEKEAGIANTKAFRNEVVNFVLRYRSNPNNPKLEWTKFGKIKEVISKHILKNSESILPHLLFESRDKVDEQTKKDKKIFLDSMKDLGYTERQAQLAVEWFQIYTQTR